MLPAGTPRVFSCNHTKMQFFGLVPTEHQTAIDRRHMWCSLTSDLRKAADSLERAAGSLQQESESLERAAGSSKQETASLEPTAEPLEHESLEHESLEQDEDRHSKIAWGIVPFWGRYELLISLGLTPRCVHVTCEHAKFPMKSF
eukprot:s86_g2.t1